LAPEREMDKANSFDLPQKQKRWQKDRIKFKGFVNGVSAETFVFLATNNNILQAEVQRKLKI